VATAPNPSSAHAAVSAGSATTHAPPTTTDAGTTMRVAVRLAVAGMAMAATPITQPTDVPIVPTTLTASLRSSKTAATAAAPAIATATHAARTTHGNHRTGPE
jgi:hypothetical protein